MKNNKNERNPILSLLENEKSKSKVLSPNLVSLKKRHFFNSSTHRENLSRKNSEIISNKRNKNSKIKLMNNNYKIDTFYLNELSDDILLMQNYNIQNYISRTDESEMKKKIILRLNKIKNYKEPLSVCLINKNFQSKENNSNRNKLMSSNFLYFKNLELINPSLFNQKRNYFKVNNRTKSVYFNKKNNLKIDYEYNHKLSKDIKNYISNSDSLNEKDNYTKKHITNIIYSIFQPRKEEVNKKKMFKNLKIDVKRNELKIKDILDNLIRTQRNNEEDLKRKRFIIKSIQNQK
jgi:hypothetical protein